MKTKIDREDCLEAVEAFLASRNNKERADRLIASFNHDFDIAHNLDDFDHKICAACGVVAGMIDCLFLGIPHPSRSGIEGGLIDNKVREWFDKLLPPDVYEQLARNAKVSYDAQDNRNTTVYVEGLSAYFHRLISLGHDPVLGFFVGVYDILQGTMTCIDKKGNFSSQSMANGQERMSFQILEAIVKQWKHLLSDVNTSMGLPAPFWALLNLFQFGKIGEEGLTIAEVAQGMFFEGYDLRHFVAMSVPQALMEILVRASWFIRHGRSWKKTPLFACRRRNPKLQSMLAESYGVFMVVNAGKVAITKNPCAINYPVAMNALKLLCDEIGWQWLGEKDLARAEYVDQRIDDYFKAI